MYIITVGDQIFGLRQENKRLKAQLAELNAIFDSQHKHMTDEIELWCKETGQENVSPDLGHPLQWLMERTKAGVAERSESEEECNLLQPMLLG